MDVERGKALFIQKNGADWPGHFLKSSIRNTERGRGEDKERERERERGRGEDKERERGREDKERDVKIRQAVLRLRRKMLTVSVPQALIPDMQTAPE